MPKFSVIVPTHNGEGTIRNALRSVLAQAYTDYELIVVCDACEDNTAKIAREYGATVVTVDYHRDGLSRNAGLDIATGEWVLFLDDDDWFLHEFVFTMLAEVAGKQGEQVVNFNFLQKDTGYVRQSQDNLYVMCWCRCCRRDFIGNTRFNNLPYGSDRQFYTDLISKQPDMVFWDTPMYYYNANWRSWKQFVDGGGHNI